MLVLCRDVKFHCECIKQHLDAQIKRNVTRFVREYERSFAEKFHRFQRFRHVFMEVKLITRSVNRAKMKLRLVELGIQHRWDRVEGVLAFYASDDSRLCFHPSFIFFFLRRELTHFKLYRYQTESPGV